MKILIAQSVLNNRRGGMSRLMGFIHDEVEKAGHQVDYLGSDSLPPIMRGKLSRFAFPWMVWRHAVAAANRGEPYDIVNVHEPSGSCITWGKKAAGNPLVVAMSFGVEDRGWEIVKFDAALGRNPLSLKTKMWHPSTLLPQSRYTLKYADHVFCSNEEDRTYLELRYNVPSETITRVHSGATREYLSAYDERNYTDDSTIVFFGTWIFRKGITDLVRAFEMLSANKPDLKLIVMGPGAPSERVLSSFPVGLRSRVLVIDPSPATEYAKILRSSALMVIPSLFEGTPLTMMESMAAGLPVVATSTCGMRDIIQHGENGMLVPMRDPVALAAAMGALLASRTDRERMGRAAHSMVAERYTWPMIGQAVLGVYERLYEAKKPK
jgi:glycosyltransferase involved in cell wall biosynthesis